MPRRARVIVTTYERPHLLRLALRAWRRQTFRDLALTVADDGSGPETTEIIRRFAADAPFPVDHVRWEHDGYRRAGILNESVRRSAGEPLLLLTDGDCVPPARFLERHVAVHGPRSFAVGGAYKIDEAPSAGLTEADIDAGRHEALRTIGGRLDLWWRAFKCWRRTAFVRPPRPKVIGLNMAVDRSVFEDVNGFDEAFVGYGLEDCDLADRLVAATPPARLYNLYGRADTIHLWHPMLAEAPQRPNRAYYESERPVRCRKGLVNEG